MSSAPASSAAVLRGYFRAKDENRPHLLARVFAEDAELVIHNASTNIAFPADTRGRDAIAEVLVRSFTLSNEDIYSFYLCDPPAEEARAFDCAWLVGMSERASGQLRVGCGTYAWSFDAKPPHLATRLVISIESMQVLPRAEFEPVFAWLESLSYPWSPPADALRGLPAIEALSPVAAFLGRSVGVAPSLP